MKKQLVAVLILFCLLVSEIALADQRPHIVLVMADDPMDNIDLSILFLPVS